MDSIRKVFSNNLKKLRGELTQAEAAEKAQIPLRSYQKAEAGKFPRKENLGAIAGAFGVKETALFLDPELIPKPTPPSPREALKSLENLIISLEKNKGPAPNSEPKG